MDAVEFLKEKMVLAFGVLQSQDVVDVYGHVSARLPGERILSTPYMPPGKVALWDPDYFRPERQKAPLRRLLYFRGRRLIENQGYFGFPVKKYSPQGHGVRRDRRIF